MQRGQAIGKLDIRIQYVVQKPPKVGESFDGWQLWLTPNHSGIQNTSVCGLAGITMDTDHMLMQGVNEAVDIIAKVGRLRWLQWISFF